MTHNGQFKIFTGTSNPALAEKVCERLGKPLGDARVTRFPDGEIDVKINDDIRGADVFLVQSTCPPVNDALMELLLMIDASRRASAGRITAVLPYYGYARKDRKDEGRVPISARLVADLITAAGTSRVLTIDLHTAQIQGFFDIPVDHLYASPVIKRYIANKNIPNLTIVSPDVGRSKVARAYAKRLDAGLAIVDKRRVDAGSTEVLDMIGSVEGRNVFIIDDMIATGGSIVDAAKACRKFGAKDVYVACTHAVMCGPAVQRLMDAQLTEVVVCDTIPMENKQFPTLKVLTVADLLAEAIRSIHYSESVSRLFDM
ncbi:MAG: ribose-phosphate pyrophosphokinase [Planctomycetes bacterium]|nr:ribose-phosphate pyrophosphokinase [Planctomycetota bacterium]NUQ34225.1 ribose-phosphate pyrophosphokinase [Planctomycetaceae bacterium]